MSIVQIHRFREIRNVPHVSDEPPAAVTVYARALAEARILSFNLPALQRETPARQSVEVEIPRRPQLTRPLRVIRVMFRKWTARRVDAQRIRDLEFILRGLDSHTLRDIGFEVTHEKYDACASRSNALVHAVKAACKDRPTGRR